MTYIERGILDELTRYQEALTTHEGVIRTALSVYVERLDKNAAELQAAYQAGQDDPEVKAQQDASFMTNRGYQQLAQMSAESAKSARKALDDILNAILGPEDDSEES